MYPGDVYESNNMKEEVIETFVEVQDLLILWVNIKEGDLIIQCTAIPRTGTKKIIKASR